MVTSPKKAPQWQWCLGLLLVSAPACSSIEQLGTHEVTLPTNESELNDGFVGAAVELSRGDFSVHWHAIAGPEATTIKLRYFSAEPTQQFSSVAELEHAIDVNAMSAESGSNGYGGVGDVLNGNRFRRS